MAFGSRCRDRGSPSIRKNTNTPTVSVKSSKTSSGTRTGSDGLRLKNSPSLARVLRKYLSREVRILITKSLFNLVMAYSFWHRPDSSSNWLSDTKLLREAGRPMCSVVFRLTSPPPSATPPYHLLPLQGNPCSEPVSIAVAGR